MALGQRLPRDQEGASTGWKTPDSAARWGRWPTYFAVIIPVLYAVTPWAWALGFLLGISEESLREGQEVGLWWAGAALATLAVGGAILTLGLVLRWGEVFPRWIPFLGGKRVPISLAVVPASLVAVLVTRAGLMFVGLTLTGRLCAILGEGVLSGELGGARSRLAVIALGSRARRGHARLLLPQAWQVRVLRPSVTAWIVQRYRSITRQPNQTTTTASDPIRQTSSDLPQVVSIAAEAREHSVRVDRRSELTPL